MIELRHNELIFTFPDLETRLRTRTSAWIEMRLTNASAQEKANLPSSSEALHLRFRQCLPSVRASVSFQRTLRIPDDGKDYPLPPGLGRFPVFHVDDYASVPESWKKRGGVMMPMHKTEALWLNFSADYPMALKVAAGGICAVSGERWSAALHNSPQNYVVLPEQPWLDGFRVSEGIIRQFVAVPLKKCLTVEQQLTGEESWGGLQIQAFPMASERYWSEQLEYSLARTWEALTTPLSFFEVEASTLRSTAVALTEEAGLGAGGRMKQEITADPYGIGAWDTATSSRCYVHLCIADDWQRITGAPPPHPPPSAKAYTHSGLPWFDYQDGNPAVPGQTPLSDIKSVNALIGEKTGLKLPDNDTVVPTNIAKLGPRRSTTVREY